jgi:membrane-bound lytic murein transglycosylase D
LKDRKATWGFLAGALVGAALTALMVVGAVLALHIDFGARLVAHNEEVVIAPLPAPNSAGPRGGPPCDTLVPERPPWWPEEETVARALHLPTPSKGLKRRVEFWEALWGEHGAHVYLFVDKRRPSLLHAVVDCNDLYGPGIDPVAAELRCDRRLLAEKKKIRGRLYQERNRPSRALRQALDNDQQLIVTAYSHIYVIEGKASVLSDAVTRAAEHLANLEKIFASVGVPPELTRLAFVESLFQPAIESHAGAVGAFQFVAATGGQWLMIQEGVDERKDPERSGWASAQYLKGLHRGFDDWPLALTAYNTGPTRMRRLLKRHGTRDIGALADMRTEKAFGFDGQNYYAQIVAVVRVTENIVPLEVDLARRAMKAPGPLSLSALARCTQLPGVVIAKMNPALGPEIVSGKLPIPKGYLINLPAEEAGEVSVEEPGLPGEQPS